MCVCGTSARKKAEIFHVNTHVICRLACKELQHGSLFAKFSRLFLRIETFFFYISLLLLLLLLLLSLFLSLSFSASVVFLQSHLVPAAAAVVQKKKVQYCTCACVGAVVMPRPRAGWLGERGRGEERTGGEEDGGTKR